jgi:adenylylsulfate kinase
MPIRFSPLTVWLTGLSGAGKTTLAQALERRLLATNQTPFVLDGDRLRNGLCKDLGFDAASRSENIRRIAEVAKLMNEASLIVVVSCISPYAADRETARSVIGAGRFLEVHVSTPIETCESRDPKGLYRRARTGELAQFTGISAPYESPVSPALIIDTTRLSVKCCVDMLLSAFGAPIRNSN